MEPNLKRIYEVEHSVPDAPSLSFVPTAILIAFLTTISLSMAVHELSPTLSSPKVSVPQDE